MKITCTCGKSLPIPDALAGKRVRCPYCQAKMTVPGGPEELPVALDSRPTPEELLNRATEPEKTDHDPLAALGDLAAAIDEPNAEPAMAQPIVPGEDSDPTAAEAPDGMGDLVSAIGDSAEPATTIRPAASARPVAVPRRAKPAAGGVAVATAEGDEPPAKKRDMMPIIMMASAGALLLAVVIGLIVASSGGSDTPKENVARDKSERPVDDGQGRRGAADTGFLDGIGHSSAKAAKEHYEKMEKEKEQNNP